MGGANAAWCWVACTSHWADGWVRLPWPGCPSFQCTATSMGTAYTATDTDLSGAARTGDIVWEIPGESPWCIHMLACWHTHKHQKWGLGCPDKLPTSLALWCLSMGETQWPGRRWVDKWKVRELSREGTRSPRFLYIRHRAGGLLGARRHTFILSLFIQSITTTCARWRKGHRDSAQSMWEVHMFMCVWACICGAAKAGVPDCRERIRSLECKTLLDPSATFEAKSLAHICPSWVMIQLVAPLECWPLMHLITQSAWDISIHWQWGLS